MNGAYIRNVADRAQLADAPAGLVFKRFSDLCYWVRPAEVSFRSLWAVEISADCGQVTAIAMRVAGYHGTFAFDWHDSSHVGNVFVQSHRPHGLMAVQECIRPRDVWVFCNAKSRKDARHHPDVSFVASRINAREYCNDLTGVYFISNGRGAIKIGLSDRRMYARLSCLQQANPDQLTVAAVIPAARPEALEHELHLRFAKRRIRNEWFAMTEDEAREVAVQLGGFSLPVSLVDTK